MVYDTYMRMLEQLSYCNFSVRYLEYVWIVFKVKALVYVKQVQEVLEKKHIESHNLLLP